MKRFFGKILEFFGSRRFSSGAVTALVIMLVLVANIIIYTLASVFGLYISAKATYDYSIGGSLDSLFESLNAAGDKKVTVTFCMPRESLRTHSTGQYVLKTAEEYSERYSFIEIKYINLLTKMDEDGRIVDLSKYEKDLRGNDTHLRTHSIIFSTGEGAEENYTVLTDTYTSIGFADFFSLDSNRQAFAYVGEERFGSMVAWVLNREHKVAYFTMNHNETIDVNFANLLTSAGYYVDANGLDLGEVDVPDDAGVVVISNPTHDFRRGKEGSGVTSEIERLGAYMERGGSLYVAIDPLTERLTNLEDFIAEWGIEISGGEGEYGYSRDIVYNSVDSTNLSSTTFLVGYADGEMGSRVLDSFKSYKNKSVLITDAAMLKIKSALGAEPLLVTSDDAVAKRQNKTVTENESLAVAAASVRTMSSGKTSSVVLIPSVLLTNADVLVFNGYTNKEFVYSVFDNLLGAHTALYGTRSVIYDNGVVENLTQGTARALTVVLFTLPAIVAVVGAVITIRRKYR